MAIDEERAKELLNRKQAELNSKNNPVVTDTEEEPTEKVEPVKSLGKSRMMQDREERSIDARNLAADIGWKNIPIGNLPSKGVFYPAGTQITIRAASVTEVRHFSTIEEEDFLDIDDKLNFIMEKCVRVKMERGITSYKDLLEVDRFSIIFAVRELTFKDGENKLQMDIHCNQCGTPDLIEITKYNFNLFSLDEKLQRFYSPENRSLIFTTKGGETVELFIPTLGVTGWIKNLIRTKRQKNEFYDQAFLKMAPFLFKEWRSLTDTYYNKVNSETLLWNVNIISIVVAAIDLLLESVNSNITNECKSCGAEVKAPINFRGGIKGLFLNGNIFDELV